MFVSISIILVSAFAVLLFLNIYFRIKVLGSYKYLVRNKVEFGWSDFLDNDKMVMVCDKYPQHKVEITQFVKLVKRSITMASILLAIILFFGYILMRSA